MAIGFIVPAISSTVSVKPDKTLSRATKPSTITAKFGDGYEQRSKRGLNPLEETYSVTLANRPKAEADDILKFFDDKAGVTSFDFTIPDSNNTTATDEKTIRVVCDTWSIQYNSGNHYSLSATFRRVYQP
tara:strand:- start:9711 stop:10100 length:390 start_codon:yes stop_codon:yes gene_type:complete